MLFHFPITKWMVILLLYNMKEGFTIDQIGPHFREEPPLNVEFSNNTGSKIICSATGHPNPNIYWIQSDGNRVVNIPELRQLGANGELIFKPFRAENYRQDVHAIRYKCLATNAIGTVVSRDVNVKAVMAQQYEAHVYDAFPLKGNTAILKCHLPSFIESHVVVSAWIKNNAIKIDAMTHDNKYKPFSDELFIFNIGDDDVTSSFRCETTNKLTNEAKLSSTAGKLFISDPKSTVIPRIIDNTVSISASINSDVTIPCIAQGHPTPELEWFLQSNNGQITAIEYGRRIVRERSAITIHKIQSSDAGFYTCQAKNSVGQTKKEINVTVSIPLSVRLEPKEIKLDITKRSILKCIIKGNPITSISWLRNGQPFPFNNLSDSIRIEESGMYQCFAANEDYIVHDTAQVIAGDTLPEMKSSFEDKIINPGNNLKLKCLAIGNPQPDAKWLINDEEVEESNKISIKTHHNEQTNEASSILEINNVITQDGGLYTCQFVNVKGVTKHSNRINVVGLPGIKPMKKILGIAGRSVQINCPYYGYPITQIKWIKEFQSLPTDSRQFLHDNGSLFITKMLRGTDDGVYTCVVSSGDTEATQDVEIVVMIPPKIMPFSFQEDLLREGMRARLQCVVSEGDSPLTIQWLKDDEDLPSGITVRNLDEYSSILTITNINPKHNGNYTCKATNPAATSSHSAKLNVNAAPKIIPFSFQEDNLIEGVFARVSCVVYQGDLPISIRWLKDDHPINNDIFGVAIRNIDEFSSILTIDSVQQRHTGNYTCVAENSAAIVNSTASLIVNVPPKIVPFNFQDEHLLEGMLVRVSCVISRGDLPLTISWLKDGQSITKNDSIVTHDFDDYSSILSIDPVTVKHNGNYTCIATNAAASVTYSSLLSIKVPPKWITMPNDTSVVIGSELHLPCATEGFPKPSVTWIKSEGRTKQRQPVINNRDHIVLENGTLHIFTVKEEDKGFYFCEAKNGIGWLGATAQVTIKTPPNVLSKSKNINSHKNEDLKLRCEATGDSPITFEWKFTNNVITVSSKYAMETSEKNKISISELSILNVNQKDSGIYQCTPINIYGNDTALFHLIVKDVPLSPIDLKVLESANRTITITWSLNENPVTKYVVQYKQVNENWKESKHRPIPGKMNSARISHLQPSQKYQIRVLAENEVGLSEPSNIVEAVMAEEAPSATPNEISIIAIDTNTLRVSWKSPPKVSWNGIIRGYNVGYKILDSTEPYEFRLIEVPEDYTDILSLSLTNLLKFTRYSIVVQALNDGGKGPLSKEIIAVTSESVPTKAPTDIRCSVLTSESIHITWQPPPSLSIHGVLQGYKVIFKPTNLLNKRLVNSGVKPTTLNKITLNNLLKYENYSLQVLAFTKKGDGVRSDPIYCRTLEDVPGPVADIKILPASEKSVLVAWKSPDDPNGAISKYTIYVKNDESENAKQHSVNGNITFQEISFLKQNSNYEFWVTASTIIGEGPRSRAVVSQLSGMKRIPAKVAVFNSAIITTEDKDIKLPCPAIGIPEPRKKWTRNRNPLELSDRMTILSDGALLIKDSRRHESDNYTCHVENERGDDLVTYSVIVQSVPQPVVIDIALTTTTSIDILWKIKDDGGALITGFKLVYRHDQMPWKSLEFDSNIESYHLDNLNCGSKYQLYMTAINVIGEGKASLVTTASTKGGVPSIPSKQNLIEEGSTFVTLNLNSWQTDNCPITYFVVEYKAKSDNQWRLHSDDVENNKRKILLSDLKSATWYKLRMIAHTSAGTAVAEFVFATLTPEGATILPDSVVESAPTNPIILLLDLKFIMIFSTGVVALLLIIITILCCCSKSNKKSRNSRSKRPNFPIDGTLAYNGSTMSDGRSGTINSDELTPYATARLSDFSDGRHVIPRSGSNLSQTEFMHIRNQMPTAPPMTDSYNSNSLPFYSQVHKKGNQAPMTPNRPILKSVAMSIPAVPLSKPPEFSSQRLPPVPPPLPDTGNKTEPQKKYDSPWDIKHTPNN